MRSKLTGVCVWLLAVGASGAAAAEKAPGTPTFTKDVAPILYENCVACHRPNHLAPMPLITYQDARPWARAVKSKVVAREMPPWGADSSVRAYKNDTSLSQDEIATIAAWVDGGAPEATPPTCRLCPSLPKAGQSVSPISSSPWPSHFWCRPMARSRIRM